MKLLTLALTLAPLSVFAQALEPLKLAIDRAPLVATGMSNYRVNVALGAANVSTTLTLPTNVSVTSPGIAKAGIIEIVAISNTIRVPLALCPQISGTNPCGANVPTVSATDGTGWIFTDGAPKQFLLTGISGTAITKLGIGSPVNGAMVGIQFFSR